MEENTLPRWEQKLNSYRKALSRLAEVVNVSKVRQLNDFEADGLIQRFEFTFELAWKLMKSYADYQGTDKEIMGSRDAVRWSFENKLIEDSDITLKGSNLTYLQLALLDAKIDDLYLPYFVDLSLFSMLRNTDLIESIEREGKVLYRNDRVIA